MRKLLVFLVIAALTACSLSGCGPREQISITTEETITTTDTTIEGDGEPVPDEGQMVTDEGEPKL